MNPTFSRVMKHIIVCMRRCTSSCEADSEHPGSCRQCLCCGRTQRRATHSQHRHLAAPHKAAGVPEKGGGQPGCARAGLWAHWAAQGFPGTAPAHARRASCCGGCAGHSRGRTGGAPCRVCCSSVWVLTSLEEHLCHLELTVCVGL